MTSTVQVLFQFYPVVTSVIYGLLAFVSWYGLLTLDYGLNGGQLGRGRWWVFECLWEDILMNIPGGGKRKADVIREMVGTSGNGSFMAGRRSWTHEELRQTGEYEACGRAMFGSPLYTWVVHIVMLLLAVFIGPTFICAGVLVVVFLGPVFMAWDWLMRKIGLVS